ncbi:MAG: helix-turn-helix transcriptional regulator [Clostridiales bacterium]|nr:helix-turn-helix transcriptional regulator [Clostridiales bacterium]
MADRIKFLREQAGLTQEELGEKIGVQKSAIRKYEKGEVKNMKRSSIRILSDLFNVSPTYLMGWDDEKEIALEVKLIEQIQVQYGKQAIELLSMFTKLNDAGTEKALETISDLLCIEKYRKEQEK